MSPATRLLPALPAALTHLAFAVLAALLLVAAGQPLFTDDAWWHLALGRAYAEQGPWLAEDPLLFTAERPPAPAAWLSDLALYGVWYTGGFLGLRITHVATLAGILLLAWSVLRRGTGSPMMASLGTGVFVVLGAYRLFQLRPELFTIAATLALYRLLLEGGDPPSRRRIAAAVVLLAVWANAHGAFLLGPVLLAAALAGLLIQVPLRGTGLSESERIRAARLATALVAGLLATLANPAGISQLLPYFTAGVDTPALARVVDDWARFRPLALPVSDLPPTPLAWVLIWVLAVLTPVAALRCVRSWRRGAGGEAGPGVDPALLGIAGASLLALLVAVRLSWLALFPMLLVAAAQRATPRSVLGTPRRAGALAASLLVPGFLWAGDWPLISGALQSWPQYLQPYGTRKYHGHAVRMLEETGLQGNLVTDYELGGFIGFWLAPGLRTFVNGTLNYPGPVHDAYTAIRARRGSLPGEGFLELLDRYEVDVFLGTRLPQVRVANRPWHYTTSHLEGAPGWIPVFRNLDSAVYLRANPRNRANLERVIHYYGERGVPFDAELGFSAAEVIRSPAWAARHGLVPIDFAALDAAARDWNPAVRRTDLDRLADTYAALGLYEHAARLDRRTLASAPGDIRARRRLVWSLLRLQSTDEALAQAEILAGAPPDAWLAHAIVEAVRRHAVLRDAGEAAALVATLPFLAPAEADALKARVLDAPPWPAEERPFR
jgi:hypothetical protein